MTTSYEELLSTENALSQAMAPQVPTVSGGLQSLTELSKSNPIELRQSALGAIDRLKYGFADTNGRMKILMSAGYSREQIVPLQNGELGVRTEMGIKPVDPKGLQITDMMGDISESFGKGIPTVGAAAGATIGLATGGLGSIVGAGAGAGGGEILRQKIGDFIGVRDPGMSEKDFSEAATETLLGAGGQAFALGAGKLLSGLMRSGSLPGAATADDILRPVTTETSNIVSDALHLKRTNSEITKRFMQNRGTQVVKNLDELSARTDLQLTDLIENKNDLLFKQFLEPELRKVAQTQGIANLDDVAINMRPTVRALSDFKNGLQNSKLLATEKKAILAGVNETMDVVKKSPFMTYGQFKELGNSINNKANLAYKNGDSAASMRLSKIYDTLVDSRAKVLSPNAFKAYSQQRASLGKLDELFRVKLSEGELRPGQMTLVGKLAKFSDEVKHARNYNIFQSILDEAENAGVPGIKELRNSTDSFLFNNALSKAKATPGVLGKIMKGIPVVSGVGDVVTSPLTDPVNQARVIKGLFNSGALNPTQLNARVSETVIPRVNTLMKLIDAKRLIETGTPISKALDMLSPEVKAGVQAVVKATGPGIPGAAVGRTLNQLLYGKQ